MIDSLLDQDLYKLSMGQAVMQLYPRAIAKYEFINRGGHKFPDYFGQELRNWVNGLGGINLQPIEAMWMRSNLPFLTPAYIDFFRGYRFNPGEVSIDMDDDDLKIRIVGPWYSAIYWEVPLMAMISELYYKDRRLQSFTSDERTSINKEKAVKLKELGVRFADFGTRRRFSYFNHEKAVRDMVRYAGDSFVGTSNLALARRFGIKPIGTMAHEWLQFHAAKYGFRLANEMALEKWVEVYQGDLGIALPDTFTTDVFLRSFGMKHAKLFDGIRHDSGSPINFALKVIGHYNGLDIDPNTKTIVFSDSLNVDKIRNIQTLCNGLIKTAYGIGTNLTNDVGVEPMNMVIKMTACSTDGNEWQDVIKLSDSQGKYTGNGRVIDRCKEEVGI